MLPLRARLDLGMIAMKGYSAFPKALELLEPQIFLVISRTLVGGILPEVKSVYSTAPQDWENSLLGLTSLQRSS